MADLCSIEGCDRPIYSRKFGWCGAHYRRGLRHGDPLVGRTHDGEPHRFLAEEVIPYSGEKCLDWPYARDGRGYARIRLDGKARLVSRVVCEHAYGAPPTSDHQAAHSCGRGQFGCVTPSHLRWATQSENEADKIAIYGARTKQGGYQDV